MGYAAGAEHSCEAALGRPTGGRRARSTYVHDRPGYIAKYATKATETATGGTLLKPIRSPSGLDRLTLADHPRALVTTAWKIGQRTSDEAFRRWAHQFGYGGHTLTKSREYSVTFAALRAVRSNWRLGSSGEGDVIVRAQLTYAGRGHPKPKGTR